MKAAAAISSAWIFCPSASAMHSWGNKYVMIYIWRRLLATIHRPIPTATNLAPKVGKDRYVGIWGCAGHSSRKIQNAWSEYCRAIPFSRGKNRFSLAVSTCDMATGKLPRSVRNMARRETYVNEGPESSLRPHERRAGAACNSERGRQFASSASAARDKGKNHLL